MSKLLCLWHRWAAGPLGRCSGPLVHLLAAADGGLPPPPTGGQVIPDRQRLEVHRHAEGGRLDRGEGLHQEIRTAFQRDGPNHLGLWLNQVKGCYTKKEIGPNMYTEVIRAIMLDSSPYLMHGLWSTH